MGYYSYPVPGFFVVQAELIKSVQTSVINVGEKYDHCNVENDFVLYGEY